MTPEEREMLVGLAKQLLGQHRGPELVAELSGSGVGSEVWSDLAITQALFELQGLLGATSTLLDLAVLRPGAGLESRRILLPVLGSAQTPGRVLGGDIAVDGIAIGAGAERFVVGTDSGDVLLVPGLPAQAIEGFDPALGLVRVMGSVALGECTALGDSPSWDVLVARAARTIAYQLIGVAAATRGIATRHVTERHQFGRPIGSFQSVRHRLADALIAETGAREVIDGIGEPTDPMIERLVVKALAGRAALLSAQAAQQVTGAMGFTDEFGLHPFVRRAYVLDALLGGSEDAEHELGSHALATGRTPDRLVHL